MPPAVSRLPLWATTAAALSRRRMNDAHVDNDAAAGRWPDGVPAPSGAMVPGLWRRRRPLCHRHRRHRRREQRRGQCACHLRSLALALVP
jgi:hypothetical protein